MAAIDPESGELFHRIKLHQLLGQHDLIRLGEVLQSSLHHRTTLQIVTKLAMIILVILSSILIPSSLAALLMTATTTLLPTTCWASTTSCDLSCLPNKEERFPLSIVSTEIINSSLNSSVVHPNLPQSDCSPSWLPNFHEHLLDIFVLFHFLNISSLHIEASVHVYLEVHLGTNLPLIKSVGFQ